MASNTQDQMLQVTGRTVFSGKVLYQVRWSGTDDLTWEDVKLVKKDNKHLIKAYMDTNKLDEKLDDDYDNNDSKAPLPKPKRGRPKKGTYNERQSHNRIPQAVLNRRNIRKIIKQAIPTEIIDDKSECTTQADKNCLIADQKQLSSAQTQPKSSIIHAEHNRQEIQHQVKVEADDEGMTNMAAMSEVKTNQSIKIDYQADQIKIYCIDRSENKKIKYVVEDHNGHFMKCYTEELIQKYPKEFISFLQRALINKINNKRK